MTLSSRFLPFYDSLSDGMFRRDQDGRQIFYPAGYPGSGRIVSDEDAPQLRSSLRRMWIAVTLGLGPILAFAPDLLPSFPAVLALMAAVVVGVVATTQLLARRFAPVPAGTEVSATTDLDKTFAEPRKLIVMFTLSIALVALNASILLGPAEMVGSQPQWLRSVAWMGLGFFAIASLAWLRRAVRLLRAE